MNKLVRVVHKVNLWSKTVLMFKLADQRENRFFSFFPSSLCPLFGSSAWMSLFLSKIVQNHFDRLFSLSLWKDLGCCTSESTRNTVDCTAFGSVPSHAVVTRLGHLLSYPNRNTIIEMLLHKTLRWESTTNCFSCLRLSIDLTGFDFPCVVLCPVESSTVICSR